MRLAIPRIESADNAQSLVIVQFEGLANRSRGAKRHRPSQARCWRRSRRTEASRMVTEKVLAACEAQIAAAMAAMRGHKEHVIAGKALNVYGKRVRANRRRLSQ